MEEGRKLALHEYIHIYNELKTNREIIESIDKDFFFELVENLIKGYRELEEKQKNYDISYNLGKAFANKQWETKVKEKMEELDKQLEEADELDPYKWVPLTHKKEVLQELMEDK